jgi:AcrR family transcriptional regulator
MTDMAHLSLREKNRQTARDVVLDAAERLLRKGEVADFSMRALAAEAGVGFATPFNHFGNKNAIMQALSKRLIDRMAAQFRQDTPAGDVVDRVWGMDRIAVAQLLEKPDVYKAVVGSLGVVSPVRSNVVDQSRSLWTLALGDLKGCARDVRHGASSLLATHLAYGFRGCLSFWIAGEITDAELPSAVQANASAILLGFVLAPLRRRLLATLYAPIGAPEKGGVRSGQDP